MRRVVVTGIGSVNPLGADVESSWRNLLAGNSGANTIDKFDAADLPCRIACQVKRGNDGFNADIFIAPKEQKRVDDFITFAIAGADMALADSGYVADTEEKSERAGVMIGAGIGGLEGIEAGAITLKERGPRRLSPFFIPGSLINLAGGQVSIKHGLKGPNHAVVTACSTGAHAIGDAARIIMWDDADVMVAGGSESAITPLGIAGFAACRALSTGFNDRPTQASRPYDKDRDGFVMGEGVCCMGDMPCSATLARAQQPYRAAVPLARPREALLDAAAVADPRAPRARRHAPLRPRANALAPEPLRSAKRCCC